MSKESEEYCFLQQKIMNVIDLNSLLKLNESKQASNHVQRQLSPL